MYASIEMPIKLIICLHRRVPDDVRAMRRFEDAVRHRRDLRSAGVDERQFTLGCFCFDGGPRTLRQLGWLE
jgi:hypothetical protein